jgi:hypothetical protein
LGVVFAMAIGHGSFSRLTTKKPFTETKQKKNTPRLSLRIQYWLKKSLVVDISFFMANMKKRKTIRSTIRTPSKFACRNLPVGPEKILWIFSNKKQSNYMKRILHSFIQKFIYTANSLLANWIVTN